MGRRVLLVGVVTCVVTGTSPLPSPHLPRRRVLLVGVAVVLLPGSLVQLVAGRMRSVTVCYCLLLSVTGAARGR